jgi:hypothetical protein
MGVGMGWRIRLGILKLGIWANGKTTEGNKGCLSKKDSTSSATTGATAVHNKLLEKGGGDLRLVENITSTIKKKI